MTWLQRFGAFVVTAILGVAALGVTAPGLHDRARVGDAPAADSARATTQRSTTAAGTERERHRSPLALEREPRRLPVEVAFRYPPRAGILFDVDTGEVLWSHHPNRSLPIASLTKMMTALIVARRHRLDERVLITPEADAVPGSRVGVLPKGERVPLWTLLDGLLLVSGNDAAVALAQHDAGSVGDFVDEMNRRAEAMGLRCSHFTSPHGLQDEGNHSCASDLATLARADLANPHIREIAGSNRARFRFPVKGGYLDLYNNNPFIRMGVPGITGLKTGYTDAAGRCYVTTRRRGGRELGVVLLDTPNPYDQVPALLRAGFRRTGS